MTSFTVAEDLGGEMLRYRRGQKKRAHLKHAGRIPCRFDRTWNNGIRRRGCLHFGWILCTRRTGILPASAPLSCPSCFTAVSPLERKCLARRVMISHRRILPKLSQFVGSADLMGNQHRLSLKEQLGLFNEPSCNVMKPDKRISSTRMLLVSR